MFASFPTDWCGVSNHPPVRPAAMILKAATHYCDCNRQRRCTATDVPTREGRRNKFLMKNGRSLIFLLERVSRAYYSDGNNREFMERLALALSGAKIMCVCERTNKCQSAE